MTCPPGWNGTPLQRFWKKIKIEDGHWLWTGSIKPDGYGLFRPVSRKTMVLAHRWAYEQFVGPIYEETIDHICKIRNCVNPQHLEQVGRDENMFRSRRTHCVHGHPLSGSNLYVQIDSKGREKRSCKTCTAASQRRYKQRKKVD